MTRGIFAILTAAAVSLCLAATWASMQAAGAVAHGSGGPARPPTPPPQPREGPGGATYPHAGVTVARGGDGEREYWVFEPAHPRPGRAPVVVMLHGWGAMLPDPYAAWIDHLVRRGNIVVYPRYQTSLATMPSTMTGHALEAVRAALIRLAVEPGRVRPRIDRLAVIGHSLGGVLAANLAVLAARGELPPVRALMVVQPGDPPHTNLWFARSQPSIMEDYVQVDPSMLALVVVGDMDRTVGDATARVIFRELGVTPANKNYVVVRSDTHGQPPLLADHYAPTAVLPAQTGARQDVAVTPEWMQSALLTLYGVATGRPGLEQRVGPPDALDYYGFWKLLDGLMDAAFYLRNRDVALGGTPQQTSMGTWSDGVPVRPVEVQLAIDGDGADAPTTPLRP